MTPPKINGIWIPAGDKFKRPVDFHHLFGAKGNKHEEYVAIVMRMGITDVCDCDLKDRRIGRRVGSGSVGMMECTTCGGLVAPTGYMYPCDECCEPILADHFPVSADETLLCTECLWG